MEASFKAKLSQYQQRVETGIDTLLPSEDTHPVRLHRAMRYSMEAGGKRLRPVLVLALSELADSGQDPIAAAVAIECLHTYTLIHDDLPSLDNSDLRRGRPSCHKQFDEPTAVLAGDALLTFAFELLSREYASSPELAVGLIQDLADASGSRRLIGGQQEDIDNEGKPVDADTLQYIHENKTAALLTAALSMGLRFTQPGAQALQLIQKVGFHLGMTFQIVDDILDATSSAEAMGKPVGNDASADKTTYVALHGIEGAREHAKEHTSKAIAAAKSLGGNNRFLLDLIEQLEHRIN
ncbi:polyprenyl synthetase family protein [Coraliomargarita akajimensis]|uniref:Polyprenyl synthetase n=1 Tax=Coraliomargarita akajimensis (strain DSM 45221 / IAM 15411 / JCM 23193 / KCTC 12865 / 04OKA010-24) TaxID=583355 RepID=D5EHV6_CORAD|nr:farnesyl diphosphate synthase [Coraliomargarita akajimensis]ADE54147.1 Polyprenyl synthetase [Coraliomargarita akajimensis DSM 45221]